MAWSQGTVRTGARVPMAELTHADPKATATTPITAARLTFERYGAGRCEVPYSRHDAVAARVPRSRNACLRRLGRSRLASSPGVETSGAAPGAAERGGRRDGRERASSRRRVPGERKQLPAGRRLLAGAQPLAPAARPPRRGQS